MSNEQVNPFDDESQDFLVLKNVLGQYSLWPSFAAVPTAWNKVFGPESHARCLEYIELNWLDIRITQSVH